MSEEVSVTKYGTRRKNIAIPRAIEDEVEVGDKAKVYIDRKRNAILYVFSEGTLEPPKEFRITEEQI